MGFHKRALYEFKNAGQCLPVELASILIAMVCFWRLPNVLSALFHIKPLVLNVPYGDTVQYDGFDLPYPARDNRTLVRVSIGRTSRLWYQAW